MKKRIKLTNDFHNTEITVLATVHDKYLSLSAWQVKHIRKKLCPSKECQCSNSLGTRNSEYIFEVDFQTCGGKLFNRDKYL